MGGKISELSEMVGKSGGKFFGLQKMGGIPPPHSPHMVGKIQHWGDIHYRSGNIRKPPWLLKYVS